MTDADTPAPSSADSSPAGSPSPRKGTSPAVIASVVLTGLAVCGVLGVLIGMHFRSNPSGKPASPSEQFRQADDALQAGRLDEAVRGFQAVRREAPNGTEARKAQILVRCAQARQALGAGDAQTARVKADIARDLLREAAASPDLADWAEMALHHKAYLPSVNVDAARATKILEAVRDMMSRREYRKARAFLERAEPGVKFTPKQDAELAGIQQQIVWTLTAEEIRTTIRTASQLAALDRLDRASDTLTDAQVQLRQGQQAGRVVADEAKLLEAEIEAVTKKVDVARQLRSAEADIHAAREAAQLRKESEALQRAIAAAAEARPQRVAALKQRQEVVARELAFAAALAQARQAPPAQGDEILRKFIQANPDHQEAKTALAALQSDREWGQWIAEGDQAMREGKWAQARAKYQAAGEKKEDPSLERRHRRAEYELIMQQARAARDAKRWNEAMDQAKRAAEACPDAAKEVEAWKAETSRQEIYEAALARARGLMDTGDLDGAGKILAQMDPQTPDVLAMRDEVAYVQEDAKGRSAMGVGDYKQAYEHFKAALEHARPGDETRRITDLLRRVERLKEQQERRESGEQTRLPTTLDPLPAGTSDPRSIYVPPVGYGSYPYYPVVGRGGQGTVGAGRRAVVPPTGGIGLWRVVPSGRAHRPSPTPKSK